MAYYLHLNENCKTCVRTLNDIQTCYNDSCCLSIILRRTVAGNSAVAV